MTAENKSSFFLRISAAPNCNLACEYCNPEREFNMQKLSNEELLEVVKVAYESGIDRVHWTGGEPTMRPRMVDLVRETRNIGISTQSISTNGVLFAKMADDFREAGLTGASISLDSLNPEKFREITGVDAFYKVYNSIVKSCDLFPRVVVNMVVMRKNFEEIGDFVEFAQKMDGRFVPRFCELQPFGPAYEKNPEKFEQVYVSRAEIVDRLKILGFLEFKVREEVDKENAHAEYFTLDSNLVVGVIAPHSNGWPCARESCGRVRVGPNGAIRSCVFSNTYELKGLPHDEKLKVMQKVIEEKQNRINENNFPKSHIPAYRRLRFGLE